MNELIVFCPSCKADIRLTESLAAPLLEQTRKQYETRIAKQAAEAEKQQAELQKQKTELAKAKASIEDQVSLRVITEREKIAAEESQKARSAAAAAPRLRRRAGPRCRSYG